MWNYKGYGYERISTDDEITGFVCCDTDIIDRRYPVSKHSDIHNAVDYELHYRECNEMQLSHDKEIK